ARPGEVVGVDVADDPALAQPRAHVARMAETEELRVIVAIVDKSSGSEVLGEFALDPAGHVIGRAVVEHDELEAGMVRVPREILRQGLLQVMQPSHADGEKRKRRRCRGGGIGRNWHLYSHRRAVDPAVTHGKANLVPDRSTREPPPPSLPLLFEE